jgi:hypothetical protein
MGIRFLCPNGHKLNVKSFLGGKKAICPKCGVRVVVPTPDEHGADFGPERGGAAGSAEPTTQQPTTNAQSAPLPASVTTGSTPLPAAMHRLDPIDEAPNAVWYVRPATGGQFGPASSEMIRTWINGGRVGASSLVWRTGWPEWRSAAATFPQLESLLAAPVVSVAATRSMGASQPGTGAASVNGMNVSVAGALPTGQIVQNVALGLPDLPLAAEPISAAPELGNLRRRRPRKNDMSIIVSSILVVVSIILVIVLVLVWHNKNAATDKKAETHRDALLE